MSSLISSIFNGLTSNVELLGVINEQDLSVFSANIFVVAVVFLIGSWTALHFVLWAWARRSDRKELERRVRLGVNRRFKKRAPKASRRLRASLAVSLLVVTCSWILASKESEEVKRISSVSVTKGEFLEGVTSVTNAVASNTAVIAEFAQAMIARQNGAEKDSKSLDDVLLAEEKEVSMTCATINSEQNVGDVVVVSAQNLAHDSETEENINEPETDADVESSELEGSESEKTEELEDVVSSDRDEDVTSEDSEEIKEDGESKSDNENDDSRKSWEAVRRTIAFVPYVNGSAMSAEVSQNSASRNGDETAKRTLGSQSRGYLAPQLEENEKYLQAPSVASKLTNNLNNTNAPGNELRVSEPVLAKSVDDEYFMNMVVAGSICGLAEAFNDESHVDALDNHIRQTNGVASSSAYGNASLIGEFLEENSKDKSILEKIDDEANRISALVRSCVLPIEARKDLKGNNDAEEETGCGFLSTYNGHTFVITNYHVVDETRGNESIKIFLPNNQSISPSKTYACPDFDIAVLEIKTEQLPSDNSVTYCRFGDSDSVQVANLIFTVGSPFGLEKSVTYGHVSSLRRSNQDLVRSNKNTLPEYIQIDAAINPGNSGGPLCNSRGEVIGVVTAIATTSGKNEGVAFAIPSNILLSVVKTLIDKGEWRRSRLGVELSPATRADLSSTGLTNIFGTKVVDVQPKSPAVSAGLRPGDLVMAFNGLPVADDLHFARLIALANPDEKVRLSVFRGKKFFEMEATLVQSAAPKSR